MIIIVFFLIRSHNDTGKDSNIELSHRSPSVLTFKKDEIFNAGELKSDGNIVGRVNVKYIDTKRSIFSEMYIIKNIDGKDYVLYTLKLDGFFELAIAYMKQDGFFHSGDKDIVFVPKEYGGFLGYHLVFIGNDFFLVQYLGLNNIKIFSSNCGVLE